MFHVSGQMRYQSISDFGNFESYNHEEFINIVKQPDKIKPMRIC